MILRLGGRDWKLTRPTRPLKGWARDGTIGHCIKGRKVIQVLGTLTGKEELATLLHEARHAQNWDLDEEAVERESRELAEMLWAMGYRRT